MKLYDFPFSPNCRKVRAVAYELGIPLDCVPVNLIKGESRTPAFLARNPNGRVPVLEDDGFVLWESTAILGANGQPGFAFHRDGAVRAIEVVELRDGAIWRMHHFMQPALIPLFVG